MIRSRIGLAAALATLAAATTAAVRAPDGVAAAPRGATCADTTGLACRDFYSFANQAWLDSTKIPAIYPAWGAFYELQEHNETVLKTVLEDAATHRADAGSPYAKLGTFYATCMDSAAAEAAGAAPLQPELARIAAARTPADLAALAGRLRRMRAGVLWSVSGGQDDKNSNQVVLVMSQGGLGLPDRDYYLKTDSASVALRNEYVAHVARVLRLLGQPQAQAEGDAQKILRIETALAQASMTRVQQRDPNAIYHKLSMAQARALAPSFDWAAFLREAGAPAVDSVLVRQPDFISAAGRLLQTVPVADWQAYFRWRLADQEAQRLSSPFVNEDFAFGKRFSGATELQPRWKRCLAEADNGLGELLGQAYVQRAFTPAAKARADEMVRNLRGALAERIRQLAWMSEATKQQALAKLDAFQQKIGYPTRWRDYAALQVQPGPFVANASAADRFEFDRRMRRIGRPVDRTEWGMTPPTVNAYYNAGMNEIVFPAGILQPPFFDPSADDATNYGAMGAVIGHEATHGFDDEGRQYDAAGNLRDWWTAEDAARYNAQAERIIAQFSGYTAVDTLHLNGKLTAGENIADLGGLTIAYAAMQRAMQGKPRTVINGFTPEQRFFLGWARVWRELRRPEYERLLVTIDPHSPSRWRVNGPLSNMPEFAQAWGCQPGDAMVRADSLRVRIW
ncbi:MAG TPA: M13 family metallopeptidase [Longimicrobiaceae bacterium]